ncbi:MAG: penicillin-binding transpeptidase domain-containing protein [Bryobacterales bacterium]
MRFATLTLALLCLSTALPGARHWYTERSTADSPAGDYAAGEDPAVREAAIEALGKWNGSVVVVDADSGRVLTMVNQKLALADGFIPCSTVKLSVGLAALSEGVIQPEEKVYFPGPWFMTMVEGLAISNNVLFDHLGEKLGFERFRRYAKLFGFGEKAGWKIPGEQLGAFPEQEHPDGVGRMTSFGDGISATPLQMAAFTAALANGGKLYYLQHPNSTTEVDALRPKLKRQLPIAKFIPEIERGMAEAVRRGTGKHARVAGQQVRGKTGTCSQYDKGFGVRMGWFASYDRDVNGRKLAVVVMLRGNGVISGPLAAEVAGKLYHKLGRVEVSQSAPKVTGACDD